MNLASVVFVWKALKMVMKFVDCLVCIYSIPLKLMNGWVEIICVPFVVPLLNKMNLNKELNSLLKWIVIAIGLVCLSKGTLRHNLFFFFLCLFACPGLSCFTFIFVFFWGKDRKKKNFFCFSLLHQLLCSNQWYAFSRCIFGFNFYLWVDSPHRRSFCLRRSWTPLKQFLKFFQFYV